MGLAHYKKEITKNEAITPTMKETKQTTIKQSKAPPPPPKKYYLGHLDGLGAVFAEAHVHRLEAGVLVVVHARWQVLAMAGRSREEAGHLRGTPCIENKERKAKEKTRASSKGGRKMTRKEGKLRTRLKLAKPQGTRQNDSREATSMHHY